MFRLAAFNVLAHNGDDHSRNFLFLMDEAGDWRLSLAYDLTFSSGPGGEQSTVIMGEGKAPHLQQLRSLGAVADLSKKAVAHILDQTQCALADWSILAKEYGVKKDIVRLIGDRLGSGK